MKIKTIKAKCFLSVGTTPIEIDFTKLGNIINIQGHNYDRREGSSNGAGKSTILEVIGYALYGKLLKEMSHKEAINTKIKKGLEVQITFEKDGHDYHIIRKRKPDSLELWVDGATKELGGQPETQKEIEKAIGLTYDAFTNIAFFGQHNQYAFLSCDPAKKREIVENLLGLEKYNRYCQIAKDKKKEIGDEVVQLVKEYELAHQQVEASRRRISQIQQQQEQWIMLRQGELDRLRLQLAAKDKEIANTDQGTALIKYQQAQEEIPKVRESIEKHAKNLALIEERIEQIKTNLDGEKTAYHELTLKVSTWRNQIENAKINIKKANEALKPLGSLQDGQKCPLCYGVVGKDNYHNIEEHHKAEIERHEKDIKGHETAIAELTNTDIAKSKAQIIAQNDKCKQCVAKTAEIKSLISGLESRKSTLESVKEPIIGLHETLLAQQRDNLVKFISLKEAEIEGGDPYREMFDTTVKEQTEHEKASTGLRTIIKEREARLPYYDYWIKGFGDKGIRSLVIDSTIPSLNTRINYWLQFLIDNQIKLVFDNNLKETIESNPPDGDPFVYNGLSGGEHLRIDLAISQAFAYLMMLSLGTCPSIVALDEVVTYQDRPGVHCIYAMICELARDRQVIVISHDQDLLQMMQGTDTITVDRKNGFSTATVKTQ